MKKIEAIVRPDGVKAIRRSLLSLGISNMTLLEAKAMGKLQWPTQIYRGAKLQRDYLLQVTLEVYVADQVAQAAVAVMIDAARTGQVGSGSIFVSNVEEVVRLRTEEIEHHAV